MDSKMTHLQTELYIKDGAGFAGQNDKSAGNSGYAKREFMVHESSIIPFSCQTHIDIFSMKKILSPSLNLKIPFVRNEDSFSIITKTSGGYKIKILDLTLCIDQAFQTHVTSEICNYFWFQIQAQ